MPLFLHYWGPQLYGEWLMLSAIPVYLAMADGGFGNAACRDMTMRAAAGDRAGALRVFQSTWALILTVSFLLSIISCLCLWGLPLREWLGFYAISNEQLQVALLLLTGHILFGLHNGLLNGGFWAAGQYPLGMAISSFIQLLEFGGIVAILKYGGGPVAAAAAYAGCRAAGIFIMWLIQQHITPWLKLGLEHASLHEIRHITRPALASLAIYLGNAFNIHGVRLVVGLILGPVAVAAFVPLRTLCNLAMQPRVIINCLIEPELGLAFGSGDLSLFRRLLLKSCRISFWICAIGSLLVLSFGSQLLPLWTGGKVALHWPAFIILGALAPLNAMWQTALMAPYATNRHGRIGLVHILVYGVLALVFVAVGTNHLELAGSALALLICEAMMTVFVMRAAMALVQTNTTQCLKTILRPPFDLVADISTSLKQWRAAIPS